MVKAIYTHAQEEFGGARKIVYTRSEGRSFITGARLPHAVVPTFFGNLGHVSNEDTCMFAYLHLGHVRGKTQPFGVARLFMSFSRSFAGCSIESRTTQNPECPSEAVSDPLSGDSGVTQVPVCSRLLPG